MYPARYHALVAVLFRVFSQFLAFFYAQGEDIFESLKEAVGRGVTVKIVQSAGFSSDVETETLASLGEFCYSSDDPTPHVHFGSLRSIDSSRR